MIESGNFIYKPNEYEAERASNGYLISLIALMGGIAIPVINLAATFFFYISNRSKPYFTRWHCTQVLLSQAVLFLLNSTASCWTLLILWSRHILTDAYIAFLIILLIYNICLFAFTIFSAVYTRKGKHVKWFFYGSLTDIITQK